MSDRITDPHASGLDHGLRWEHALTHEALDDAGVPYAVGATLVERVKALRVRADAAEAVAEMWRKKTEQARAELERATGERDGFAKTINDLTDEIGTISRDRDRLRGAVEEAKRAFPPLGDSAWYKIPSGVCAVHTILTAALSPAPVEVAQNDEDAGRALLAWLDKYEAETKALPLGVESPVHWQSAYNARIAVVREARAAISAALVLGFPAPGEVPTIETAWGPATRECDQCGDKVGEDWTSWQCPGRGAGFGSCDGKLVPISLPIPTPPEEARGEGPKPCGPCSGSGKAHSIFDPCGCEPECEGLGVCGWCKGTRFDPTPEKASEA